MKKLIALSVMSFGLVSAKAQLTWDWSFTQLGNVIGIYAPGPDTGSGTFTTDNGVGGVYSITGATGTYSDSYSGPNTVTSATGAFDYPPSAPGAYLSAGTVTLGTADGLNFIYNPTVQETYGSDGYLINAGSGAEYGDFTITPVGPLSPVPEPTEWAAISAAMLGVVYIAKRRLAVTRA